MPPGQRRFRGAVELLNDAQLIASEVVLSVALSVSCIRRDDMLSFLTQGLNVSPEDIVVQTGCGAVLSNMFQLLAEPGESVLIPAPYYPAFENDMKVIIIISSLSSAEQSSGAALM